MLSQVLESRRSGIPLLASIGGKSIRICVQHLGGLLRNISDWTKRLKYCGWLGFTLDPDNVQLAKYKIRDELPGSLVDNDVYAVLLGQPLES